MICQCYSESLWGQRRAARQLVNHAQVAAPTCHRFYRLSHLTWPLSPSKHAVWERHHILRQQDAKQAALPRAASCSSSILCLLSLTPLALSYLWHREMKEETVYSLNGVQTKWVLVIVHKQEIFTDFMKLRNRPE